MKLSNSQPIVLWVLMLAMALLVGCRPTPRGRTAAVLNDVETYINEHPDSALAVLRQLNSADAPRGAAQRARLALLHSMALDKCYIDLQTDSILAPAVAYYERHGTPDERLRTQYYLGRLQYNAGDYQEAIVTYTEALELSGKATDQKYIGFVNQAIADTYTASFLREEADSFLEHAYHAFLAVPDTTLAKLTLYKQAISSVSQRKWEQADSIHKVLLENPEEIEDYLPRVKASYALSLILRTKDNAAKACSLFEEALSKDSSFPSANYYAAYAYCLSVMGQMPRAERIYDQLISLYPTDKGFLFWRSKVEADQYDYQEAYYYLKESLAYQDSVLRKSLNQSTVAAQKEFFSHKATQERDRAQHRKELIVLILLLFITTAILTAILIIQYNQKVQHEKARLLQLIDTIQRQSERAVQDRDLQYTHLFQDYFNTLGKICADYEEGKISETRIADKAVLRRIDRIVHDFVGNADSHQAFEDLLDSYLDNIMSSFRKDFPKMKSQDYQLASYVFSGIDMATTSVLMGLDVDVLYTRKSRLKSTIAKTDSSNKDRYLAFFK